MTWRRVTEFTLWVATLSLSILAGVRSRGVITSIPNAGSHTLVAVPRPAMRERPDVLLAASEGLVARDPFRLERRPSAVPYNPALGTVPSPAPRPPRPTLAVTGILGGPPWEALLEGVPGRQGSVLVRRGDTLGGLHIRSVTKDTVWIRGMDTTWVLSLRRVWQ